MCHKASVVPSESSIGEAQASKHTQVAVGMIEFLNGCWTESLSFWWQLAGDLLQFLAMDLSLMMSCFIKVYKWKLQWRESTIKKDIIIFCNLIMWHLITYVVLYRLQTSHWV